MFKGKVTIIKNVNGKEEKIEKEFTDPKEYEKFMRQMGAEADFGFTGFDFPELRLSLPEWGALGRLIDSVFEDRLSALSAPAADAQEQEDLPVDVSKYEQEAKKIEEEKQKKKEKAEKIKKAIDKLKGYLKTFEKEGEKKLAESVKKDIKKLEEELKALK